MKVKQLVGWTNRSVRQERGLAIQALSHQADVSAAWLGAPEGDGRTSIRLRALRRDRRVDDRADAPPSRPAESRI